MTQLQYNRRTAKVAKYFPRVQDGKLGIPISIQCSLTDTCFNRCPMCEHPMRPQRKIEVAKWLEFFHFAIKRGLESVCYSGGDSMAYQQFNLVMDEHLKMEIPFGIITTGYVPPHIDVSLLSKAAWVRVSLDAVTPEVYAKVRGAIKVEKVLSSVERLLAAGTNVELNLTVHAGNADELPKVLEWAKQRNINKIDVKHLNPPSVERGGQIAEDWEWSIQPFKHCHASLYQLYFDADGSVYPCCITAGDTARGPTAEALGNWLKEPWEDIWGRVVGFSRLEVEQLPSICKTCCLTRLNEINTIGDKLSEIPLKSFF